LVSATDRQGPSLQRHRRKYFPVFSVAPAGSRAGKAQGAAERLDAMRGRAGVPSFPKAPVWAAMSANRLPGTVACHRIRRHRSVGSQVYPLFNDRRRVQANWFGWAQVCISAIPAKPRLGHDCLEPLRLMLVVQIEKSATSSDPVRPVEMAGSPLANLCQIGFVFLGFVH
jgi:hypothetical protein